LREGSGAGTVAGIRRPTARAQLIEAQGIRIVRFSNAEVMNNIDGVTQTILAALAARAHPQPLPQAGGER